MTYEENTGKIKVGIIGCGTIAEVRHAPEFTNNQHSEIAGYFDPKYERAAKLSEIYGGEVYASYEDMLADQKIDAICVCTSNAYHAKVAIAALKAGKHVLCEKPIATSVEDANRMIAASNETGKYLMIGHNQRLNHGHIRAKEILKSGELGKILSFRSTFGHGGPESWSADKGAHTWFFKASDAFVGSMGDLGVHKVDLIRWLIDDEIQEVMAYLTTVDKKDDKGLPIEVDDNAVCILKSKTGVTGTLTVSWTYYGEEENSTVLYCSNGIMRLYDNPDFPIIVYKKNGEKSYYKVGKIQTNYNQTSSGIADMFIKGIKDGVQPEISGDEGLAALKIILACMESSKNRMAVSVI